MEHTSGSYRQRFCKRCLIALQFLVLQIHSLFQEPHLCHMGQDTPHEDLSPEGLGFALDGQQDGSRAVDLNLFDLFDNI